MKKVVIIGGGISGLTAAIYAQQSGFSTEIYEKNAMLGGECTGWDRQGYHIDNCIHWLLGCRSDDALNEIWRNIGALDDETELYREPYFYKLESNGTVLHFWNDIEKSRAEFLSVAPEDTDEINRFFDSVKASECLQIPCRKSMAEMNLIEYMKFGMQMAGMAGVMKEYGKETVGQLSERFKNAHVRDMMRRYFNNMFNATSLISSCGFFTSGTAAIPHGGSVGLIRRIAKRYEELGGIVHTGMTATKVNISGKFAESVTFSDGSTVLCDGVICASDFSVTFGGLLDEKYMDKNLRKMYTDKVGYRVSSGFNVSFGIVGEDDFGAESGATLFPCKEYKVGTQTHDFMGVRIYDYDNSLFPKSKRVLQCNMLQTEADYDYWESIYDDKERYNNEKQRIASEFEKRIVAQYPALEGRLVYLCSYTPVTFTKWCGAYKGAYMSFFPQVGYKSLYAKNTIRGLSNVFAAGQWLSTNGGLPIAAANGRFAADALIRAIKP